MTTDVHEPEAPVADKQAEETAEALKEQQETIQTIVPNKEHRVWTIGTGKTQRNYTQRPLSYFGKLEFFSLLGETIDRAMQGESGLTVTGMMSQIGVRDGQLALGDFRDPDIFVQGVTKLMVYTPDFIHRCYCIWLNIPPGERMWAVETMAQPPEEGGLSDDDGFQIIETFLDQNMEAMEDFFMDRVPKMARRARGLSKRLGGASASSKP